MKRDFPFPLPNGWFQVAWSDELARGELKRLKYFGKELVLYRGENGNAHALDAYCPHLGADLGCGGRVVGNNLRCPFHHWEFDGDGACVEIPYANRIPPKASLKSWLVVEKNGMIYAHYHQQGESPVFDVPDLPEFGDEQWTPFIKRDFIVRSRNQELAENTCDPAHFKYVHGTAGLPTAEADFDGPLLKVKLDYPIETRSGEKHGEVSICSWGYGIGITRFTGIVETTVFVGGTPVDDEYVHNRMSFTLKKLDSDEATKAVGEAFVNEISRQFTEDIPIWENKIYLDRPLLCDGDGPIAVMRRWGQQFYSPSPGSST